MVGTGGASNMSKEAFHMMALHHTLRSLCLNSDWTYSVFWTIRPRPRVRGGNGCKVGDDNGSLMLMWEDGFCRDRAGECLDEVNAVKKAFSKMSIQLYNYGEGLMGKVASDKCHKWVFKEPTDCETNQSSQWLSSIDALPPEWTDQFESGIQTIVVIQAGHGLLQLGSSKIIPEDLHFVLRMRHTFESLGYQSGLYLSQIFSPTRDTSIPYVIPSKQQPDMPVHPPQPVLDWGFRSNFQSSARFEIPSPGIENMARDQENDTEWPNGSTFFNALAQRTGEADLLVDLGGLGRQTGPYLDRSGFQDNGGANVPNEPFETRAAILSSSTSLDQHAHDPGPYDNEVLRYSDVMY